jgi:predicted metal-dependent HD superfamily phosphohydrolase
LRHDNEERSAQWAAQFLRDHAIADPLIEDVERLILTTTHAHFPQGMDASLMVDIDLAILGSDEREYGGFEDAIRREYRWVPWALYRRKRAALLRAFLERPAVFQHEPFVSDYEAAARRNLAAAIRRLEDG